MDESWQQPDVPQKAPPLIQNWISLFGVILAACSFFAVTCLIAIDFYAGFSNPYMGILTYLVAPSFLSGGLLLILFGVLRERRRRRMLAPGEVPRHPRIDFKVDAALVAGLELRGPHLVIANSWRADLNRILADLAHDKRS